LPEPEEYFWKTSVPDEEIFNIPYEHFEKLAEGVRSRISHDPVAAEDDLRMLACIEKEERERQERWDRLIASGNTPTALAHRAKEEAKEAAKQAYMKFHGYEERPEGFLQARYPKAWSAWHRSMNQIMAVVIGLLFLVPLYSLVSGDYHRALVLAVPTTLVMAYYAPLYTVVGLIPYWVVWSAIMAITDIYNDGLLVVALFTWYLYPLIKGLCRLYEWEQERKFGLPLHPVSKHPYAVAAACIGTAAGVHYLRKK